MLLQHIYSLCIISKWFMHFRDFRGDYTISKGRQWKNVFCQVCIYTCNASPTCIYWSATHWRWDSFILHSSFCFLHHFYCIYYEVKCLEFCLRFQTRCPSWHHICLGFKIRHPFWHHTLLRFKLPWSCSWLPRASALF